MLTAVTGVVKNGIVIPNAPLPEGACVEIQFSSCPEVPAELQEELTAWQRASANALELVENLSVENEPDEKR